MKKQLPTWKVQTFAKGRTIPNLHYVGVDEERARYLFGDAAQRLVQGAEIQLLKDGKVLRREKEGLSDNVDC